VLFDRDGTLVHDVPYNGDPESVQPLAGAAAAVATARGAGWRVGMVTNQRAVALGLVTAADVRAVNARVEARLGPFDGVAWCPHDVDDRCRCRKPAPGMILDLAAQWGIDPATCVVIGDTAADLGAAAAAGALGILVPNDATAADEVATAPLVATSLLAAVQLALHLSHSWGPSSGPDLTCVGRGDER
jgi:histidinol-phosphate phosphatase family protein